jgi:hypothetical protein
LIESVVNESYGQAAWTNEQWEDRRALRNKLTQRPHWLITKYESRSLEVLTMSSEDGGDAHVLPVFSFEEEAQMYLRFWAGTASEGWRVRETSVGELASVLYGPCASVSRVALDPLPEVCGGSLLDLLSVERDAFVEVLLEGQFSAAAQRIPSANWGTPADHSGRSSGVTGQSQHCVLHGARATATLGRSAK